MARNLERTNLLIGKTEGEVLALLGNPDGRNPVHHCLTYAVNVNARCTFIWNCDLQVCLDPKTSRVDFVKKAD